MGGQTKSEIRSLLAEAGLAPQYRFGQNFLIDLNLMRKLIDFGGVTADDTVLEVGPGTGSLTELLLETGARVVAVEIDRGLQELLRHRLSDNPRFTLVQGDALAGKHRVNPLALKALENHAPGPDGAYRLVANLPYQIATPLLVDLLRCEVDFARLTCTIQKEVGERLTAEPRTEAYGPVSILVQTLATVEPHAILPPSVFWPAPKVESIMLSITALPDAEIPIRDIAAFSKLVQSGFQQRRKQIGRLLRDWDELTALRVFHQAGVQADARPAELSPADWRRLHAAIQENQPRAAE